LYANRKLSEGYPDLERLGVDAYSHSQVTTSYAPEVVRCIERLIDVDHGARTVLVIGCGPMPHSVKRLLDAGYDAAALEPLAAYVQSARDFLGDPQRVSRGSAEAMPFEDNSKRIILMESVLEHVDSPYRSVAEAYRVLVPGGVLYVGTTNRWKFSLTGYNGEFHVRFYNWLPDVVKESYVYQHLHFDPRLANYTPRPAVHWFSYPDLCKLGRQVGFAQFYSLLDLIDTDSPFVARSRLRRWLLDKVRYNPWLRALALTQTGGTIFMVKWHG
jgi:ubiquinone/menaquinone biosynthesis C-methylase UbiE